MGYEIHSPEWWPCWLQSQPLLSFSIISFPHKLSGSKIYVPLQGVWKGRKLSWVVASRQGCLMTGCSSTSSVAIISFRMNWGALKYISFRNLQCITVWKGRRLSWVVASRRGCSVTARSSTQSWLSPLSLSQPHPPVSFGVNAFLRHAYCLRSSGEVFKPKQARLTLPFRDCEKVWWSSKLLLQWLNLRVPDADWQYWHSKGWLWNWHYLHWYWHLM